MPEQPAMTGIDVLTLPALLLVTIAVGWLVAGCVRTAPIRGLLERVILYGLLGFVYLSWMGTILAALGLFRWWIVSLLVAALAVWSLTRRPRGRAVPDQAGPHLAPTPAVVVALIVLVIAAAAWLFARPADSFLLVDDSAVYTLGGIVLARTGGLVARIDALWPLSTEFIQQFFQHNASGMSTRYYGPFYQWTLNQQAVEIGYLPLAKVWIALAVWLSGPGRATWATPLAGVLALGALWVLVRRTLGWRAALVAVGVLALSLPEIWFSRYPVAEMYAQALVLGGLYLVVLCRRATPGSAVARALATWGALAMSALLLTRFEGGLMLAILVPPLLWGWRSATEGSRDSIRRWLNTLVGTGLFGMALSLGVSRYYFLDQSLGTITPRATRMILAALLGLGFVIALLRNRMQRWVVWSKGKFPLGVLTLWIGWGLFATVVLVAKDWGGKGV